MTSIPNFYDVRDTALTSDDDVRGRVELLIEKATTRQVWLMFLDEQSRQLPMLMPTYVPVRPGEGDGPRLGEFFASLVDEIEATTVIVVFERRGREAITPGDARWLRTLRDACLHAEVSFRGPLLCHDKGVRWVPLDEYVG